MSKKQIYTVFACNEWKSKDSMRLLMATTSVRKLKSFIVRKISQGEFDWRQQLYDLSFPGRLCYEYQSKVEYGTNSR